MTSQAEHQTRLALPGTGQARILRTQKLLAAGGVLGALAASSCCILPLVLFGLGISGAWIGNLTQFAPYQPYFIGATAACLGSGYWLLYRSRKMACADGEACARPLPSRIVKLGLILATALVISALAFDFLAPLFY
jgi:mercuric ion transport protein